MLAALPECAVGDEVIGEIVDVRPEAAWAHFDVTGGAESGPAVVKAIAGAVAGRALDAELRIEVLGERNVERGVEFREPEAQFVEHGRRQRAREIADYVVPFQIDGLPLPAHG